MTAPAQYDRSSADNDDTVIELVRVLGRAGLESVEFGYFPHPDGSEPAEGEVVEWWAKGTLGPGTRLDAQAKSRDPRAALVAALTALTGKVHAESKREHLHVELWRFRNRTAAVTSAIKWRTQHGLTKPILLHNGQGKIAHNPSATCWCRPELIA